MNVPGHGVGANAEPELRLDPLRDGQQDSPTKIVSTNFFYGTCGGYQSGSPNMAGGDVLYATTVYACEHGPNVLFNRFNWYSEANGVEHEGSPSGRGVVIALAWDRGTAYWIRDVLTPEESCEPGHSCEQLEHQQEAECEPGFAACGGLVFSRPRGCAPEEGMCTLMRATDLKRP